MNNIINTKTQTSTPSTLSPIQTIQPSLSENILFTNIPPIIDPIQNTMKGISYNETRGEKSPYSFARDSGNPLLGKALGAYQITEADLKRLSPRYLDKIVTPQEFLASSTLQDKFMKNRISYQMSQGYSPEQIADIHRSGTGSILPPDKYVYKHPEYVKSFSQGFNQ